MKGRPWCADLPMEIVPRRDTPKPLTLIVPYYEQPVFFAAQLGHWCGFALDLLAKLTVIVVDDGSPTLPAEGVDAPRPPAFRLFRIGVDVRWNWLAARNIGFHYAPDGWCLVTDMDHVVPESTLRSVMYGQHDPSVVYVFSRKEHTGKSIGPHSASFLMTREMFWQIGGYDEALSGHYGTDGVYRRQIAQHAPIHILPDVLERHEFVEDSSVTRYKRKQPEDAAVSRIVRARKRNWKPKVLSFPYREVN